MAAVFCYLAVLILFISFLFCCTRVTMSSICSIFTVILTIAGGIILIVVGAAIIVVGFRGPSVVKSGCEAIA